MAIIDPIKRKQLNYLNTATLQNKDIIEIIVNLQINLVPTINNYSIMECKNPNK